MRNRPNCSVERELMNNLALKESCFTGITISDCNRTETSWPSGSLMMLFSFNDFAISVSVDDFPHRTSVQGELVSIANTSKKENEHEQYM